MREVALHIMPHPWPKEVSGQHVLHLFNTKISHQTATMHLLSVFYLLPTEGYAQGGKF
jgi:hypothetical protein